MSCGDPRIEPSVRVDVPATVAEAIRRRTYALTLALLLVAAAVGTRRLVHQGERASALAVWCAVVASVATLAWLSVSFDYGDSFYPSRELPFFVSGRLVSGALIPYLVLYLNGARAIFAPFSRSAATLAFAATVAAVATASELALTWPIFGHPGNWFHLP